MSEKERKILEKLSEIVPKIPDAKKERLLWIAKGMCIRRKWLFHQKCCEF